MKIGILTFEKYEGRKNIGSSRIRGRWLVNNWEDAEIFKAGSQYDVVVYQKAYWTEHAELYKGIKILDICDPDWLHWAYNIKKMVDLMDAITVPTQIMKDAMSSFTDKPIFVIPDRIDLNEFKEKKVHEGDAKSVLWYGYSNNFPILKSAVNVIAKKKLELIVISDKPLVLGSTSNVEVTNYRFKEETYKRDIMKGDIVLNPTSLNGKWKFKSNNKTIISWACGLPVAQNEEELDLFIKEEERKKEVEKRTNELKEKWDINLSVEQMKNVIEKLKK